MKFGFVSDVHGDLEALIKGLNLVSDANRVLCLGDVSGGRFSEECLQLMAERNIGGVAGNHDLWDFEVASLSKSSREFLSQRPIELRDSDFLAIHSNYSVRNGEHHFSYIHSESDAREMWSRFDDRLIFFGHTHLAQVHWIEADGKIGFAKARPVEGTSLGIPLQTGFRYLFNVGAVKDGLVTYDTQAQLVTYHFYHPPSHPVVRDVSTAKPKTWWGRLFG